MRGLLRFRGKNADALHYRDYHRNRKRTAEHNRNDYYSGNYGIRYIDIDKMYVGITAGADDKRCVMSPLDLKPWGNKVTYHERLKESYYIMQKLWK